MFYCIDNLHVLSEFVDLLLEKWDIFTTKKDESTGPTALESDGPYFEIMGQWPGPTINLKACVAALEIPFNLICNMTLIWKS